MVQTDEQEPRGSVSPARFRTISLVALATNVLIVITGATVRLTESGLGCSDWPTCEVDTVIPELNIHAYIEYINRVVFTAIVSLSILAAIIGAWKRNPVRRDLKMLSLGLAAGVVAQILLGRLVVLSHLSPRLVLGHFLLSMVMIWNAVFLVHRSRTETVFRATYPPLAWLMSCLAAVAVFTGTLVTGSGPHSGHDDPVDRLPFDIADIARVHGISVMMLVAATVAMAIHLHRSDAPTADRKRIRGVVLVLVAQVAVGYTQYFTGVPALLVGIHVFGAVSVWIAVLWFHFQSGAPGVPSATRTREKLPALAN